MVLLESGTIDSPEIVIFIVEDYLVLFLFVPLLSQPPSQSHAIACVIVAFADPAEGEGVSDYDRHTCNTHEHGSTDYKNVQRCLDLINELVNRRLMQLLAGIQAVVNPAWQRQPDLPILHRLRRLHR